MENTELAVGNGAVPAEARSGSNQMMISRQTQEVQAAMVIAKKFPRDEYESTEKIRRTCQRSTLAEQAIYSYPRGGQNVAGPSVRLAEALAQCWGNIDYGIIELEQKVGVSEMMAYAWDLETNTRVTKIFSVEHKRDSKKGSYVLTDSRDIYEATANFGARRMRACILGVIPGDVVDMAVNECRETQKKSYGELPSQEKINKIEKLFKKDFGVTKKQLETYAGRGMPSFGAEEITDLWGVYTALKNGQAKAADYFEPEKRETTDEPLQNVPDNVKQEAEEVFQ